LLSGRGIFKALRHGEIAARAIDLRLGRVEDAMDAYTAQVHREFQAYASQRRHHYMRSRQGISLLDEQRFGGSDVSP
jgi:flavin-dependent dehydrogenase